MADSGGDKKHEATPYRRQKAREDGNIAKSQDLASALLLLAGIYTLDYFGGNLFTTLKEIMTYQLTVADYRYHDTNTHLRQVVRACYQCGFALLPITGSLFVAALAVNIAQTGLVWLPNKLSFDFKRIDPIAGFGRIFSISNSTRLGFGLLKISLVGIILISGVVLQWRSIMQTGELGLTEVAQFVWTITFDLVRRTAIALAILAILDFGFQKWKHEHDLMMTDEEIREEIKSTQGDPQIKARRRRVQRQIASQRVQNDVPKADVIVTNPTELAIAIQYDPLKMKAPIVIAKGADLVAARIRRIALEHEIPIVERKPLAQALYKAVSIGHPIPTSEYGAVAEVLKYVYQLKGKTMPNITAS